MTPLRVFHVAPYSAGAWAYGGIPRLADTLVSGLSARGHHVTLCTTDACDATTRLDRGTRSWKPRPSVIRPDGVALEVFPNASNRLAYRAQLFLPIGLRHYLRRHSASFDVAHLHACRNLPGVLAARALRAAHVPYVVSPNGTAPILERRFLAKRVFDVLAGRQLLAGAARVLAVTEAERWQFLDLGISDSAIEVVPNPIEAAAFEYHRRPEPIRGGLRPADAPAVLFLGKLTPRKRIDVLIDAFARLRRSTGAFASATLVIAGNDMGSGPQARRQIAALGLEACARFAGLLTGRARLDAMADADVVVYPSEHEIFGLVPLEALLAGTPVVVTDDSGCGEILSRIGGGIVVPVGDAARLADAMAAITADPSYWRREAAKAAVAIRASFSPDVVCARLESVYDDVVRQSARGATSARSLPLRVAGLAE